MLISKIFVYWTTKLLAIRQFYHVTLLEETCVFECLYTCTLKAMKCFVFLMLCGSDTEIVTLVNTQNVILIDKKINTDSEQQQYVPSQCFSSVDCRIRL